MFDKLSVIRSKAGAFALAVVSFVAVSPAMAQSAPADPTAGIVTTLGTYATDVGLLAAAILLIFYGKKLVSYLKV